MTKPRLASPARNFARLGAALAAGFCGLAAPHAAYAEKIHFTYLWHQEQPIYWPDRQVVGGAGGTDRYERALESLQRAGTHPQNNLAEIFGLPDRVAAYQYRMRDSIGAFSAGRPEAGAQISFSGGLIENLQSLGGANQLGYSPTWYGASREARGWSTTSGAAFPRADFVLFSFHHSLLPLCDDSAVRKEIQIQKAIYPDAWGSGVPISKGFFPSEMAFSTRLIPILAAEGIEWSFVSAEKVSRACSDFPVVFGSGGVNCDPPNKADQINPAGVNYFRKSISRGCAPAEAYPFSYTPRRAQYVNPQTGAISSIVVVPVSQHMSWEDGYSPQGIGDFNTLEPANNPSRPMLIVLGHDGDNAWGGGYSYYLEATPNRVNDAANAGYVPTVVQRYLNDHPVPANDVVHVEDGAWVNVDGDFGAPQFLNWNWPLLNASGQIDVESGWHVDARNWAVITAAQNRVDTAEEIHLRTGTITPRKIVYPDGTTNAVERAWHYFLGALNSGYMYYGNALDFEVKPSIACNEALRLADPVIASAPTSGPNAERTGPTIWVPQREPWNPGSTNFGPSHGYQQVINNGDFHIWTFAYDASGIPTGNVRLKYRIDADGVNPLNSIQNELYNADDNEVGAWQDVAMTNRVFPAGNVYNDGSLNFFEMPSVIADQYYYKLVGLRSVLVGYYIEATDALGNVKRSPIQHVWVGDGAGSSGGGGGTVVTIDPNPAFAGQPVTISYDPAGRALASSTGVRAHVGFNDWDSVISPDPAMTWNATTSRWTLTLTPPANATQLDLAFNNNGGNPWDNNAGADWHFPLQGGVTLPTGVCCVGSSCSVTTEDACAGSWTEGGLCSASSCQTPFVMNGAVDAGAIPIATNASRTLWAKVNQNTLYVATQAAGGGNDRFVLIAPDNAGALRASPWGKGGQAAAWQFFLANENDNDYISWFNATEVSQTLGFQSIEAAGIIEGTLPLSLLGSLGNSDFIAFAAVSYANANGGALVPSAQVPASLDSDTTLETNEFVRVKVCTLKGIPCCSADFDGVGGITVTDLFDFLDTWFAQAGNPPSAPPAPSADFDVSGTVDVVDLFGFLDAWFAQAGACV